MRKEKRIMTAGLVRVKTFLFLLATLGSMLDIHAQELTVKSMTAAPMDISASKFERKDQAGKACGLVKVQLAVAGVKFEGEVVNPVDYKTGEYWVYMREGSYMLSIKHPSFTSLDLNFRDYGIDGVVSKATYMLTLLMPKGANIEIDDGMRLMVMTVEPATAKVFIDNQPQAVQNGIVSMQLPVGAHSYRVEAANYESQSKSFTIGDEQLSLSVKLSSVYQTSGFSATGEQMETFMIKGVKFNMVKVEGGSFKMGATKEQKDPFPDEKPVHQVTLTTYYIGETEVTQKLWIAVMGDNPSKFTGKNHPVEQVNWDDCQKFISKLNEMTGKHFRLPTEAEWEYAARGGSKSQGYQYSGSKYIDDVAVFEVNSGKKGDSPDWGTHNVRTKQPNELGLYDMSGNVWEWCFDCKGNYPSSDQTNPTGPSSGDHILRGGSWGAPVRSCRVANRHSIPSNKRSDSFGLRLAM